MGRAATAAPAGFWHRAAAWSIDAACIAPVAMLMAWRWLQPASVHSCEATEALLRLAGELAARAIVDGTPLHGLAIALMHDPRITDATATLQLATWRWLLPASFAFGLVGAAWHVAGERSRWQGSPGKRLLGLRVTSRDDATRSLARSAWRHLAGTASWATLNLGHVMAAAGPRHLALHDRISATRVVDDAGPEARLPGWARAWLTLVVVAGVAVTAWLAQRAAALMEAGLLAALY